MEAIRELNALVKRYEALSHRFDRVEQILAALKEEQPNTITLSFGTGSWTVPYAVAEALLEADQVATAQDRVSARSRLELAYEAIR